MDTPKRQATSRRQYAKLVEMLEENADILKEKQKGTPIFWNTVASSLNELGPPQKDGSGWKKVWTDFKCSLKKKLAHNNKEYRATGGGPSNIKHFNDIENRVLELMDLNQSAGALNIRAFGASTSNQTEHETETVPLIQGAVSNNENESDALDLNLPGIIEPDPELADTNNNTEPTMNQPHTISTPTVIQDGNITVEQNVEEQDGEQPPASPPKKRAKVRAERQLEAMQKHNKILEKRLKFEEERFNFEKEMRLQHAEREAQQIELNRQQVELQRQFMEKISLMNTCRNQ